MLRIEEENFARTLDRGMAILNEAIDALAEGEKVLDGETVFKLYDTYGFLLILLMMLRVNVM